MSFFAITLLCILLQASHGWTTVTTRAAVAPSTARTRALPTLLSSSNNPDNTEEEEEDWRDFRAKLIQQFGDKSSSSSEESPAASSSAGWAYEAGTVIEPGSIILSKAEQDFGFGLRQQYFHKCVILVTDHDPQQFTRGIILNRPTNLVLSDKHDLVRADTGKPLDDGSPELQWRVWFGGDVRGLSDGMSQEIQCLHSLNSPAAKQVSNKIVKNIQWTTLDGARKLVLEGHAEPSDFWVLCGYCGWGAGQLMGELDRGSWYMAATDSQTLLSELKKQSTTAKTDPRETGVDMWKYLMERIGKGEDTSKAADFDDLMLYEFARERLLAFNNGAKKKEDGVVGTTLFGGTVAGVAKEIVSSRSISDELDDKLNRETEEAFNLIGNIQVGSMLRASSSKHSPFLLNEQEFHKSLVLLIQDDETASIGLILNLPSVQSVGFSSDSSKDDDDGLKRREIPQRFGGNYGIKGGGQDSLVWLHCSKALRDAQVGAPLGGRTGVWSCKLADVEVACRMGLASPQDFLCVSGFSIWPKIPSLGAGGIQGEVIKGNFRAVPEEKTQEVWDLLTTQGVLTTETVDSNLATAKAAWTLAAGESSDDDDYVYNSNVTSRELADSALKSWVATFLLGNPKLRTSAI